MPLNMKGNIVVTNRRKFILGGNQGFAFRIGDDGTKYLLTGEFAGEAQDPVFNGKLYLPNSVMGGIVIDNFPKSEPPKGWVKSPAIGQEGYDLKNADTNEILFGYRVANNICRVVTNIYNENGDTVATANENGLMVHKGPFSFPPWFR
jgi:hypothetical protein